MAEQKGQNQREELKTDAADDLNYEAFKEHCKRVPDYVAALKQNADTFVAQVEEMEIYLVWQSNKRFDFGRVKERLKLFTDIRESLNYLYEIKTDFEQLYPGLAGLSFLSEEIKSKEFSRKCDLEIHKLEKSLALEHSGAQKVDKVGKENYDRGTQYQTLLAIHYLLKYVGSTANNSEKAKFASFLTGYSANTFRQKWSNIHKREDESDHVWEKDMQTVRGYFETLGLFKVVNILDKDLNSQKEKL